MTVAIASHLRFAWTGSSIIALDLRADRYFRLGPGVAEALDRERAGNATRDSSALLRRAGLLAGDDLGVALDGVTLVAPRSLALSRRNSKHPSVEFTLRAVRALMVSRSRLKKLGLMPSLARACAAAAPMRDLDTERAAALARDFEHARGWWPRPRLCLPDSLALHLLLADAGLAATLVIGVRDAPFAAHCWVQAGDCLLTDTIDDVTELTPILAF